MTYLDIIPIVALILAIAVNTLAVYLQKTRRIYTIFKDKALFIHAVTISVFWGVFLLSLIFAAQSKWRLDDTYPLTGWVLILLAAGIWILAIRQIGSGGLINANFFGRPTQELTGIYRIVNDPIYVSYSVVLLGYGLITGLVVGFVLSTIMAIGLLGIEAKAEQI